MMGRYGGCFEEGYMVGVCIGESCAVLDRLLIVEGESTSIPWNHISHEELTYLLRKLLLVIKAKC